MLADVVRLRGLLAVTAAVIALGSGVSVAQDKQRVFQFAPPDGTVFTESIATAQTTEVADGRSGATTSELILERRVARTKTGYEVVETVTGGSSRSSHQELDRQMLAALKGKRLTYLVDVNGHLTDLIGTEEVLEELRRTAPADVAAMVANAFTKEKMLAAARAEWRTRVENYLGHSAATGSGWLARDSYLLPNGELVDYYTAVKVLGTETTGGRECVRVEYRLGRDPKAFEDFLGESYAAAVAGRQALASVVTVSGGGHRLLDPATLLCYGEELERTFGNLTMTMPEVGAMLITVRQTKTYRYDYR